MRIRSSLVIADNAVAVHRDRLHALTRPGHEQAFYDMERITSSAADLRVALAESRTALQALSHMIEARQTAVTTATSPVVHLSQAAVARSPHAPSATSLWAEQPAPPATVSPVPAFTGPHR